MSNDLCSGSRDDLLVDDSRDVDVDMDIYMDMDMGEGYITMDDPLVDDESELPTELCRMRVPKNEVVDENSGTQHHFMI